MKIAFITLGCKVNQYETQAMKEAFIKKGYEIGNEDEIADVYVVNTCTVTNLSDRKSRQFIRRCKRLNPESITAVVGCYVQTSPEQVQAMKEVDIIAGTNEKHLLPELVEEFQKNNRSLSSVLEYDELISYESLETIEAMDGRTRAFVKIQDGCDRFCTYCIIPYARGKVRSREIPEIIREVKALLYKGYKEIVLTGINTALYGTDKENLDLSDVIEALNELPDDFRIRLSSLEPTVINADYVKKLLVYNKLCPHVHLSIQSGSDKILRNMNRRYDIEEYKNIVKVLRDSDSGYGITTDIIVGFPGETEEDFKDTIKLVEDIEFNKVHVFRYSKRTGTKAADMKEQVSPEVKSIRSTKLISAADKSANSFYNRNKERKRRVLFEEYDEKNAMISGFSDNYIKVYVKCKNTDDYNLLNDFRDVILKEPFLDGMEGVLI